MHFFGSGWKNAQDHGSVPSGVPREARWQRRSTFYPLLLFYQITLNVIDSNWEITQHMKLILKAVVVALRRRNKMEWKSGETFKCKERWQRESQQVPPSSSDFRKPSKLTRWEPSEPRRWLDDLPAPLFVWFPWCFNMLCLNCVRQKAAWQAD